MCRAPALHLRCSRDCVKIISSSGHAWRTSPFYPAVSRCCNDREHAGVAGVAHRHTISDVPEMSEEGLFVWTPVAFNCFHAAVSRCCNDREPAAVYLFHLLSISDAPEIERRGALRRDILGALLFSICNDLEPAGVCVAHLLSISDVPEIV